MCWDKQEGGVHVCQGLSAEGFACGYRRRCSHITRKTEATRREKLKQGAESQDDQWAGTESPVFQHQFFSVLCILHILPEQQVSAPLLINITRLRLASWMFSKIFGHSSFSAQFKSLELQLFPWPLDKNSGIVILYEPDNVMKNEEHTDPCPMTVYVYWDKRGQREHKYYHIQSTKEE